MGVFTVQSTLKQKISSNPTICFFIFAFLISWTMWLLAPIIGGNDKPVVDCIDLIAAFGPSLSTILVASIINSKPSNVSAKKRLIAFTAIFTLIFVIQIIALLTVTPDFRLPTIIASIIISSLPAYVISSVYHPKQGVAQLMAGLKRVSPRSIWIWAALVLPFVWQFLGATLDYALGGKDLISFSGNLLFAALLSYPSIFFLGGPLNEEPGWRGFATPRIQKRLTPLLTGLLIGVIWTVWHLPLHLTSFYGDGLNGFLFRFLFNVPLGILFTWYYNRSGSNLFGCILFHASVNVSSGIFGSNSALLAVLIVIVFAVLVIISDKMYRMPIKDKMEEKKILSLNAV